MGGMAQISTTHPTFCLLLVEAEPIKNDRDDVFGACRRESLRSHPFFMHSVLHSPHADTPDYSAQISLKKGRFQMSDRPTFIPHLVCSNAAAAIEFFKQAFGATEILRHPAPGSDKLMHASLSINGGVLMLNDDFSAQMGGKSETPEALGGTPITLHLQVENADAAWARAVDAGAEVIFPLKDQFWGDRYGILRDPFGNKWSIGQTVAKPTAEEIEEGAKAALSA